MNQKHLLTIILLMTSLIPFSYSQSGNCKVLKPEIATSYSGECKKGLANGKGIAEGIDKYEGRFKEGLPQGNGTYRYANGDIYEGDFKLGMRSGNGTPLQRLNQEIGSCLLLCRMERTIAPCQVYCLPKAGEF